MEESVLSANHWRNVIIPHTTEDAYCSEKVANDKKPTNMFSLLEESQNNPDDKF
jgi:hypothetical protein